MKSNLSLRSLWTSQLSDDQYHKTLGIATEPFHIYRNDPAFQFPLNISSHVLSPKHALVPLWTFFNICPSLGTSPTSFRHFLASMYYVASNYRLNFVFTADCIPVGQGWHLSCLLYPLHLVGQLIGKRSQCRLAEWINQTWAGMSEFKFILSR